MAFTRVLNSWVQGPRFLLEKMQLLLNMALKSPKARDGNLRAIRKQGRKTWKKQIGHHQYSLAETAMHRFKTIFDGQF